MIKRIIAILMILSLLPINVFAATHDTIEDVSSSTASLVLGKDLTYINRQHMPISSVTYTVEKVEAWGNEATDNSTNGAVIPVANMPSPSQSSVTINLTDNGNGNATGTSTITISFTKAGYYVYKIKETAIPSPSDRATVASDTHEYFAVIYVCNSTDNSGNTQNGVYVHDITSYRNTSGSSTYRPNLSDIANVTDNGGTAATTNNSTNLGKVGKSDPTDPDTLAAYKMWNTITYQEPADFTITKNVQGNLGDLTKHFGFTVSLSGLELNAQYNMSTTGTVTMTKGTNANGKMAPNASGELAFTLVLKDNQMLAISDIPRGTTWSVNEAASNHVASYSVTPAASTTGGSGTGIATGANQTDQRVLSAGGTIEGDTTVVFTNTRTLATVTGVPNSVPELIMALIVVGAIFAVFVAKKKSVDDEDFIKTVK